MYNPAMPEIVWVTGKKLDGYDAWEIIGVFDSEAAAAAACRTIDHFVAPIGANKALEDHRTEWPGAYFPLLPGTRVAL